MFPVDCVLVSRFPIRSFFLLPAVWALLVLCTGCVTLNPRHLPRLDTFKSLPPALQAPTGSPVFVSGEYLLADRRDSDLTASLCGDIQSRLRERGYEITDQEDKAASRVACTVRTWPGFGKKTDTVSLLTIGLYTPFYYPWTVEARLTGPNGTEVDGFQEKGMFHINVFGTILLHIPTAIVFNTAVPAQRRVLGDNAAMMITAMVAGHAAPNGTETAAPIQ